MNSGETSNTENLQSEIVIISGGGSGLPAIKTRNRTYLKNSLGLCDFAWPIMVFLNTPDYLGDPALQGKIFSGLTG